MFSFSLKEFIYKVIFASSVEQIYSQLMKQFPNIDNNKLQEIATKTQSLPMSYWIIKHINQIQSIDDAVNTIKNFSAPANKNKLKTLQKSLDINAYDFNNLKQTTEQLNNIQSKSQLKKDVPQNIINAITAITNKALLNVPQHNKEAEKKIIWNWLIRQSSIIKDELINDKKELTNSLTNYCIHKYNSNDGIDLNNFQNRAELNQYLDQHLNENQRIEKYQLDEKHFDGYDIIKFGEYQALRITKWDEHVAENLCKNAQWCIKDKRAFEQYNINDGNPVFLLLHENQQLAMMGFESAQIKDVNDNPIKTDLAKELLPLIKELAKKYNNNFIPDDLDFSVFENVFIKNAYDEYTQKGIEGITDPNTAFYLLKDIFKSYSLGYEEENELIANKNQRQLEKIISSDAVLSLKYATDLYESRFELGEPAIARNGDTAYQYCNKVTHRAWDEFNPALAKIAENSMYQTVNNAKLYITTFKRKQGRIPEVENLLASDADAAVNYAVNNLRGERFIQGEPAILTSPQHIYEYAWRVIKDRWPEGEPAILATANRTFKLTGQHEEEIVNYAVNYASRIINGRWAEAEPYILQDPLSSFLYIKKVIQGRWTEAEPVMVKDADVFNDYMEQFKNELIQQKAKFSDEVEKELAKDERNSMFYAKYILQNRFPLAEPIIMQSSDAVEYAKKFIKGRWLEAEPYIAKNADLATKYAADILKRHPWSEFTDIPEIAKLAEETISKNPDKASLYAQTIVGDRWIPGEKAIINSPSQQSYEWFLLGIGKLGEYNKDYNKVAAFIHKLMKWN